MNWVSTFTVICFITSGHCFFSDWYKAVLDKLDYEVCDENYIVPDFPKLHRDLRMMLFGQDIVIEKLVPILESHFKVEPKKALVISMHGWTGSGKNYATKIVLDSIFKKKSSSEFVRMFNGRVHFPIDRKDYVDQYKTNIQNWIRGNVTKCPRSVFVFDEVDKIPPGIIDAIKPFLDYHENIDSINYRKSIFIFISNIGGKIINSLYMDLWRSGRSRLDMKYKDFENFIRNNLYQTSGAFKESSILESHLVSLYLPFLPLGTEEVEQCIRVELTRQGIINVRDDDIDDILSEMEFNSDRLSTSGCKRVSDIVASFKYKRRYQEL